MNFQALATPADGIGALAADTLLVVLPASSEDSTGYDAIVGALKAALKPGDFERKAGHPLYLHRMPGVKAQRILSNHSKLHAESGV